MPEIISHQGLSLKRLVGYHWFGGEAIFGIPISVSVSFVFLFVLFGSMLDYAGGGKYFLSLAIALIAIPSPRKFIFSGSFSSIIMLVNSPIP